MKKKLRKICVYTNNFCSELAESVYFCFEYIKHRLDMSERESIIKKTPGPFGP